MWDPFGPEGAWSRIPTVRIMLTRNILLGQFAGLGTCDASTSALVAIIDKEGGEVDGLVTGEPIVGIMIELKDKDSELRLDLDGEKEALGVRL